jgi:RNA polymerase primary sigma factor
MASSRTRTPGTRPDDDAALLALARAGDGRARTEVLERHMGLVTHAAARYRGLGLPMEDLVQEGAIGLLRAIDTYDPGRGAAFSTYAPWPVRSAIRRAVTQRGRLIRTPAPPAAAPASLDAPVDQTGTPLCALIADPGALDPPSEALRHERDEVLAAAVHRLAPRRRYVIEHYFGLDGEPRTLSELAEELHVSRQRAQAIRNEGLSVLATRLGATRAAGRG